MVQHCCCRAKKSERVEKTSELSGVQNEQNNDPGIANT
jgi:hypothetical protein